MKKIIVSILILIIIVITYVIFIKQNTPIEIGKVILSDNKKGVAIEVGNIGFSDIHIKKVLVNKDEIPSKTKIQVRNGLQDFDISELLDFEKQEYIKEQFMVIKFNTSTKELKKKVNNGTATEKDKVFVLSVLNNKKINKIIIKYRYLGVPFEQVIRF